MTDYREQAIKDVAKACDDGEDFVGGYAIGCDENDEYGRAVNYAVAQREARLRLEEALVRLRDCDWVISLPDRMDAVREIARAALDAVKEM